MQGIHGFEPNCLPMTPIYVDPPSTIAPKEIKVLVEVEINSSYQFIRADSVIDLLTHCFELIIVLLRFLVLVRISTSEIR